MSIARFASVVAVAAALLLAPAPGSARAAVSKGLSCAFAKQRVALREASALLACDRKALAAHAAVDPACIARAAAKLQIAFQRIDAKGGCMPAGDTDVVEFVVDQCTQRLGLELQGACLATGAQCGLGFPPCCTGLVCGGHVLGQPAICNP